MARGRGRSARRTGAARRARSGTSSSSASPESTFVLLAPSSTNRAVLTQYYAYCSLRADADSASDSDANHDHYHDDYAAGLNHAVGHAAAGDDADHDGAAGTAIARADATRRGAVRAGPTSNARYEPVSPRMRPRMLPRAHAISVQIGVPSHLPPPPACACASWSESVPRRSQHSRGGARNLNLRWGRPGPGALAGGALRAG
eukprot:2923275-Rhodomonas_salina.2